MSKKNLGILIVAASAAGFGTFPILVKIAYAAGVNISTLFSIRFLLAGIVLAIVLKLRGLSLRVSPALAFRLILVGLISYSGMSLLLANALHYLSAPLTSLLFYTYPIMVGVASCLLGHEKINYYKASALFICILGLFLILGVSFHGISLVGVASILGAAVMYTSFMIAGGILLKEANSMVTTTYIFFTAGLAFLVYGLLTGNIVYALPLEGWLAILGITIFSTLLGVFGLFVGISILGATTSAIISNLEPLVTVLLAVAILGERITLIQALGGVFIIAGIITFQLKSSQADNK